MLKTPWKTRGICVSAPKPDEIGLFGEFVEKVLAPGNCNLMVMIVRYRYQFKSHPEVAEPDSLSYENVKEIVSICRKHNIRLIPDMNLMGHQSFRGTPEGLLRAHPELDETPDVEMEFYCRSFCPNHPDIEPIIFDLMDELAEVFEADGFHIGLDEVFDIGKCDRCKDTPTYQIFAKWTNILADHLKEKGIETFMWGDRLLNPMETKYGGWEATSNDTERAINLINKDIVICDWHYEDMKVKGEGVVKGYLSVDIFAKAGLQMLVCPWRYQANAQQFVEYAMEADKGHVQGFMATTWCGFGDIARYMLKNELNEKNADTLTNLAKTLNWFFDA